MIKYIDIDLIKCLFDQIHFYVESLCLYCGWARIPKDNYNTYDGWFPNIKKHTDEIYWSNYRCNGLRRFADWYTDYPEVWRHFRKLPDKYPKYVYYAKDNLLEEPYHLIIIEEYKYKRCNACENCIRYNRNVMIAKLMDKASKFKILTVFLWTFGTNWDDTSENRLRLSLAWNKLTTYLSHYYKRPKNQGKGWYYFPLYKVIEVGSEGGKLHIHAIFAAPIDWYLVKSRWSKYSGIENPNCMYKEKQSETPIKAFSYVVKYSSKSVGKSRNWSFMGLFFGNKKS